MDSRRKGYFITFEGVEGAGKSTQVSLLAARLREYKVDPLLTREPGGTPLAEQIRALVIDPDRRPAALAEALLMEAARADLVASVIKPALDAGRLVICDRYADSTLAYQGAGRGLEFGLLHGWNYAATQGIIPDLTILLTVQPGVGLRRRRSMGNVLDRFEHEDDAFHQRVASFYVALAKAMPQRFHIVEGVQRQNRVAEEIWEAVRLRFEERLGFPIPATPPSSRGEHIKRVAREIAEARHGKR